MNSQTGTVLLKGTFANTGPPPLARPVRDGDPDADHAAATPSSSRRMADPGRAGGPVRLCREAGHDRGVPAGGARDERRRRRGDRQGPGGRRDRSSPRASCGWCPGPRCRCRMADPRRDPQPALTPIRP
ncbi:MAG: hypothetical protein MZU95_02680 [Desulfomicrobium escambiense]|nr:hypothetical protein [Desulfomicrobium escambiense]